MHVRECIIIRLLAVCLWFFFFQAEDGIRDLTVTGVQTCALPICILKPSGRVALTTHVNADGDGVGSEVALWHLLSARGLQAGIANPTPIPERFDFRSEERRVGEEGRSRWSADHLKKKKQRS